MHCRGSRSSRRMAPGLSLVRRRTSHNYMYGDWHPYMEASEAMFTADLKARNQNVPAFGQLSGGLLPKGSAPQNEEYIDAVSNRYTAELDYAYMVGFSRHCVPHDAFGYYGSGTDYVQNYSPLQIAEVSPICRSLLLASVALTSPYSRAAVPETPAFAATLPAPAGTKSIPTAHGTSTPISDIEDSV